MDIILLYPVLILYVCAEEYFRVMTSTDRRMPRGRAISVLSLAVWWVKLEKNYKVRHNMTQIASLLAAFYSQREGAYTVGRVLIA